MRCAPGAPDAFSAGHVGDFAPGGRTQMVQTFTCYLHRPGVMEPDLKVLDCESATDLTRLIFDEMHQWGRFEQIDVYDETNEQICSITINGEPH